MWRSVNFTTTFNKKEKRRVKWGGHGDAWGERRYMSYSFLTSALDWGEWSASLPGRAFPPGKGPPVPIVQTGRALEPVWTQRLEEKSSDTAGDRTPVVQSVVRHYTVWATPTPVPFNIILNYVYLFMSRREHNIKMCFNKLDFDGLDWIQLD
jgi:hypothetical protein